MSLSSHIEELKKKHHALSEKVEEAQRAVLARGEQARAIGRPADAADDVAACRPLAGGKGVEGSAL